MDRSEAIDIGFMNRFFIRKSWLLVATFLVACSMYICLTYIRLRQEPIVQANDLPQEVVRGVIAALKREDIEVMRPINLTGGTFLGQLLGIGNYRITISIKQTDFGFEALVDRKDDPICPSRWKYKLTGMFEITEKAPIKLPIY